MATPPLQLNMEQQFTALLVNDLKQQIALQGIGRKLYIEGLHRLNGSAQQPSRKSRAKIGDEHFQGVVYFSHD